MIKNKHVETHFLMSSGEGGGEGRGSDYELNLPVSEMYFIVDRRIALLSKLKVAVPWFRHVLELLHLVRPRILRVIIYEIVAI